MIENKIEGFIWLFLWITCIERVLSVKNRIVAIIGKFKENLLDCRKSITLYFFLYISLKNNWQIL